MNNPYNLSHEERAITPRMDFNKGINRQMTKERRKKKADRYRRNVAERRKAS